MIEPFFDDHIRIILKYITVLYVCSSHYTPTTFTLHKRKIFLFVSYRRRFGAIFSVLPLCFLEGLMGEPAQEASISWCGVLEELQFIEWLLPCTRPNLCR